MSSQNNRYPTSSSNTDPRANHFPNNNINNNNNMFHNNNQTHHQNPNSIRRLPTSLTVQQPKGTQYSLTSTINSKSNKSTSNNTHHHPNPIHQQQAYYHRQPPPSASTSQSSSSSHKFNTKVSSNNNNNNSPTTNHNNHAITGGSPRFQHNYINSNSNQRNGIHSPTTSKTTVQQKTRVPDKVTPVEDDEERPTTPDSTTEPPPQPFQEGDDVLFNTQEGTHIFGTVGMIHGQTLQILFGDGTQQWASFKRVKKLSCSIQEDEDMPNITNTPKKPGNSSNSSKNGSVMDQAVNNNNVTQTNEAVTCGSCGIVKRVAGRKALNYAPHTKDQFNCRRCLNKSRFGKNNMSMSSMHGSQSPGRARALQSSSSLSTKSTVDQQRESGESSRRSDICFHCEKKTSYHDRLHCNLCERACHLSCLAITPTPLEGDRFWDVICSSCGTQNGESGSTGRTKVFSCRRSISSWSDVAHLILSCLGTKNAGERFFDLDQFVIPFIDKNLDSLHLPRVYKNAPPESRKMFLNTALNNAKLRFLNGKDVNQKPTFWAIRDNNNHQGYPLRLQSSSPPPPPLINHSKISATTKTPINVSQQDCSSEINLKSFGVSNSNNSKTFAQNFPKNLTNTTNDSHSSKISDVVATIPKKLTISPKLKGSSPGPTSPIRSFSVTSTQYEESSTSAAGSSRTLGKCGTKGLSPSSTLPTASTGSWLGSKSPMKFTMSPTKSPPVASIQSNRLVAKARRLCTEKFKAQATVTKEQKNVRPQSKTVMTDGESDDKNESDSESNSDNDFDQKKTLNGTKTVPTKRKISLDKTEGNKSSPDAADQSKKRKISQTTMEICKPLVNTPTKQCLKSDDQDNSKEPTIVISPIGNKMSKIFKNLNGVSENRESVVDASVAGKAVKSAEVTPSRTSTPEKPSLRVRKPKPLKEIKKTKKEKDPNEGAVKKTGAAINKKGEGRGRGRPLKTLGNGASRLPTNGQIGTPLNSDEVHGDSTGNNVEFSVLKSTVEDLAFYGLGYSIHCLPKTPETSEDHRALEKNIANIFGENESASPPSYWKSTDNKGVMPWQKSKRDLKNLDSYEVVGRQVDENGVTKFFCAWKDGYGNDFIEDEDSVMYNISDDELNDPSKLLERLDQMVVEACSTSDKDVPILLQDTTSIRDTAKISNETQKGSTEVPKTKRKYSKRDTEDSLKLPLNYFSEGD